VGRALRCKSSQSYVALRFAVGFPLQSLTLCIVVVISFCTGGIFIPRKQEIRYTYARHRIPAPDGVDCIKSTV